MQPQANSHVLVAALLMAGLATGRGWATAVRTSQINTDVLLGYIRHENTIRRRDGGCGWVQMWDLERLMPDVPWSVIHAKCRRLIAQGRLNGCPCGCRGDFVVPELDRLV